MSICLGIGLSAACGFRVFVPLLVMSIASLSGHLALAHGFEWIGSYSALVVFSVAMGMEIVGYYIPWVDHLLDAISSPAAVVAGIVVTASVVTHMSPMLKWTLAVIAGGGAAGVVQGVTVLARGASTATTGGLGNPIFATIELGGSVFTTLAAFLAPVLTVMVLVFVVAIIGFKMRAWLRKGRSVAMGPSSDKQAVNPPSAV